MLAAGEFDTIVPSQNLPLLSTLYVDFICIGILLSARWFLLTSGSEAQLGLQVHSYGFTWWACFEGISPPRPELLPRNLADKAPGNPATNDKCLEKIQIHINWMPFPYSLNDYTSILRVFVSAARISSPPNSHNQAFQTKSRQKLRTKAQLTVKIWKISLAIYDKCRLFYLRCFFPLVRFG